MTISLYNIFYANYASLMTNTNDTTNTTLAASRKDVALGLEMLKVEYANQLQSITRTLQDTERKAAAGRYSTHDGFNLGGAASTLSEIATRINVYQMLLDAQK